MIVRKKSLGYTNFLGRPLQSYPVQKPFLMKLPRAQVSTIWTPSIISPSMMMRRPQHRKHTQIVERARDIVEKENKINQPKTDKVKPYMSNIEQDTLRNNNWRQTPYTGESSQVVLMSINPRDSIENEVHPHVDQFFRVEEGEAKFVLDNGKVIYRGKGGTGVVVPQGHYHQVINTSPTKKLKLYTIYSPSNHPPNTLQKTHPKND